MSDDLVKHLRNSKGWPTLGNAAADRIEALTAERDALAEKLAKAVGALVGVIRHMPDHPNTVWIDASETLAELTGGKDES